MHDKERTVNGFQAQSVTQPMTQSKELAQLDIQAEKAVLQCAQSLVGQAGFTHSDVDDIGQELRLELLVHLSRFDPSKGSRASFVARILKHKAASLLRRHLAQTRAPGVHEYSLEEEVWTAGGPATLGEVVTQDDGARRAGRKMVSDQERACLKADLARVIAALPEELRALCEEMTTKSIAQIARERHVDENWVSRRVKEIRRRFSEFGLGEYLRISVTDRRPGARIRKLEASST